MKIKKIIGLIRPGMELTDLRIFYSIFDADLLNEEEVYRYRDFIDRKSNKRLDSIFKNTVLTLSSHENIIEEVAESIMILNENHILGMVINFTTTLVGTAFEVAYTTCTRTCMCGNYKTNVTSITSDPRSMCHLCGVKLMKIDNEIEKEYRNIVALDFEYGKNSIHSNVGVGINERKNNNRVEKKA